MPAFPDDALALGDDAADCGIGLGGVTTERGELDRPPHHSLVERGKHGYFFLPPPVHNGNCPSVSRARARMRSISSRKASTSWKLRYTDANLTYATSSSECSSSIAISPSCRAGTSRSPSARSL